MGQVSDKQRYFQEYYTENEKPKRKQKEAKFGGYKNSSNPRPGYYKTPSDVYYRGEVISNATPSTFKKLGYSWAKDHQFVYFQGSVVDGADTKTFIVNNKEVKDKSGKWYRGKRVR
jgi:hypothetical protein